MKKSTKNGIIAVTILIVIAGAVYYFTNKKKKAVTKAEMVKEIIDNPTASVGDNVGYDATFNKLITWGDDYIAAWYAALKSGLAVFTLNGKQYRTAGGTAV